MSPRRERNRSRRRIVEVGQRITDPYLGVREGFVCCVRKPIVRPDGSEWVTCSIEFDDEQGVKHWRCVQQKPAALRTGPQQP